VATFNFWFEACRKKPTRVSLLATTRLTISRPASILFFSFYYSRGCCCCWKVLRVSFCVGRMLMDWSTWINWAHRRPLTCGFGRRKWKRKALKGWAGMRTMNFIERSASRPQGGKGSISESLVYIQPNSIDLITWSSRNWHLLFVIGSSVVHLLPNRTQTFVLFFLDQVTGNSRRRIPFESALNRKYIEESCGT
jgi:hypothetical protein